MSTSPNMILVASFPKSGTTWFSFLMYTCRFGRVERSADVIQNYPETLVPAHQPFIEERLGGDPFFAKSHHPYFEGLPYSPHIKQCIYIVRHPLDVMVSMLHHYLLEGVDHVQGPAGKQRFFRWFFDRANKNHLQTQPDSVGGWNHHVCSWLQGNEEFPTYLVRYEDLRANTVAVISKLNTDLNLGFSEEAILKGCALSSFEHMKQLESHELQNDVPGMFWSPQRKKALMEKNMQFVNKGTSENYKDVLNKRTIAKGLNVFSKGMALAGYL